MNLTFSADIDPAFVEWFEENSTYFYEENASVEIAFTKSTKEFITWLEQGNTD